jgi:inosine-uridine nucleoside N-ribohydrolase
VKVLLDTDIGTNIDDALCLAYLLVEPACELVGVTTVGPGAAERAKLADALCRAAGRRVPVLPGAEWPRATPPTGAPVPQARALARLDHARALPRGRAVGFMAETIRAHPGQVHLLAVGPLTNVARLVTDRPGAAAALAGLTLMCGAFTERATAAEPRETNARTDPRATATVYRAAVAVHRSVGLDVTRRVRLPADDVRARLRGTVLEAVAVMAEAWFEHRDGVTFNDPLAAATLFDPRVCRFAPGTVTVEAAGAEAGRTRFVPDAAGAHQVALDVDPARFLDRFFATFGGA